MGTFEFGLNTTPSPPPVQNDGLCLKRNLNQKLATEHTHCTSLSLGIVLRVTPKVFLWGGGAWSIDPQKHQVHPCHNEKPVQTGGGIYVVCRIRCPLATATKTDDDR